MQARKIIEEELEEVAENITQVMDVFHAKTGYFITEIDIISVYYRGGVTKTFLSNVLYSQSKVKYGGERS